jgi:acyl-CoA synthetase (NDP forming)
MVVSTAGGWGVVTADALSRTELDLLPMPADLKAELDTKLPPRWSRNNPIDLAGSETKDTIPDILATATRHPDVDAVIFLGMGIQGNTAKMEREGPFYPNHGLERIVAFHERQEHRYTAAASELIDELRKPVLTATELATAEPDNAAVQGVVESGRYCYPSSNRAVGALARLWQYSRWRQRRAE